MSNINSINVAVSGKQSLTSLKRLKILSIVLGVWMFAFGFLKFFHPISDWFFTQITNSGLPLISIPAGKLTEMLVGLMFLIPWFSDVFSFQRRRQIKCTREPHTHFSDVGCDLCPSSTQCTCRGITLGN